jgi:uncharacterized membrane protein
MQVAARLFATALAALATAGTLAPVAAADPDIDSESAAAVINELKEQGYDVQVKGVSGDATDQLTTCDVTSIDNSGQDSPDPTKTTLVFVEVACPIQHS